jgi:D-alanyl-lipoteichoic acid acyltransferase DltB (MBOAT superfamily)
MMPQFANLRNKVINYHNIALGFFIFSIGLFKKVIIADTFATWATQGFDVAERLNMVEAWITSLSYTFQLYFDFSGYTDMAIGAALLFNIKLPINFNSPYKALSIQDFWRRWHMTLSRFLKDYVYIPLGGNRKGEVRTYTNLFLTFLLGGIWHGAGWTFVLWGALHGIALIIHRAWNQLGFKMNTLLAWFITFNFVNIGWVFFRATTFDDAIKVLKGMFGMDAIVLPNALASKLAFLKHYGIEFGSFVNAINGDLYTLIWVMAGFVMILLFKNSIELSRGFTVNRKYFLFTVCLFFGTVAYIGKVSEFLYFNF